MDGVPVRCGACLRGGSVQRDAVRFGAQGEEYKMMEYKMGSTRIVDSKRI